MTSSGGQEGEEARRGGREDARGGMDRAGTMQERRGTNTRGKVQEMDTMGRMQGMLCTETTNPVDSVHRIDKRFTMGVS